MAALREMDVTAEDGPEADAEKQVVLNCARVPLCINTHQVVEKYWMEPYGDRRQEIVFIGSRTMEQKRITDALNGALLTDAELKRGPVAWAKFEDPIDVLSDGDVMEFLEVDEDGDGDEDDDESDADSAEAVPTKRGRNHSTSKVHDHANCKNHDHSSRGASTRVSAKTEVKATPVAVASVRRSLRRS